ncbi:MAG: signal recognition particle protein [Legionellales bacterium]|jgi:signal recognition particle subunit SRP54|nr:signal recognition particle protein [Legionellales bacterium]
MFDNLTKKITGTLKRLTGHGKLSKKQITAAMDDIESALLDADAGYEVTKKIRANIEGRALGQEVLESINPGDLVVKIVHDELVKLLGGGKSKPELSFQGKPAVFMLVGLQGAGKTTTVAKLARYIKKEYKKTVLVVSTDTVRPAAIEQLETLAKNPEVSVEFYPSTVEQAPSAIAKAAIAHAKKHLIDVVIVDTAGRREIDDNMMHEVSMLHKGISPTETLFVADGMLGQAATRTVKVFNEALAITGVVLTKMDGDTRGGAALSILDITSKPIKFMGIGEKVDGLDYFDSERIAGQILGMGDVVALVKQVEDKVDKEKAAKVAKKMTKGQLDLQDFYDQLEQMRSMGGIESLLKKLPGGMQLPPEAAAAVDDKKIIRMQAVISSMTLKERKVPELVGKSGSRKNRIAKGSGTSVIEINRLLKQFKQMQQMSKKFANVGNMQKLMSKFKGGI